VLAINFCTRFNLPGVTFNFLASSTLSFPTASTLISISLFSSFSSSSSSTSLTFLSSSSSSFQRQDDKNEEKPINRKWI